MPNIILTEYCNLSCPYCFASTMINEAKINNDSKNITLNEFNKILQWLAPSAGDKLSLGLIGGEPTLHPKFEDILITMNNFNALNNSKSILFTNGLQLQPYLNYIGKNMSILINVNKLNKIQNKQLIDTLRIINSLFWFNFKKVTLGCNLYAEEDDYSFFWNIVDLFSDIKIVRMSVTAPINEQYKNNKFQYYTLMKPKFYNFILEAKKRNILISYDCNQIPLCFFTAEEQALILSLGKYESICSPTIDITPNFFATSCFGVYNPIDCSNFNNLEELNNYFQGEIYKKLEKNNSYPCGQCKKLLYKQCQGGCLSFSILDNNL